MKTWSGGGVTGSCFLNHLEVEERPPEVSESWGRQSPLPFVGAGGCSISPPHGRVATGKMLNSQLIGEIISHKISSKISSTWVVFQPCLLFPILSPLTQVYLLLIFPHVPVLIYLIFLFVLLLSVYSVFLLSSFYYSIYEFTNSFLCPLHTVFESTQ